MKLIIQIPCFNEAKTLPLTVSNLPRHVRGCNIVEWLVIDDGSSDGTAEIATELGVDHIIKHPANKGLAAAFMTGLSACIERGADVIVNTDADNQYDSRDIEKLVIPIILGEAEMVVGARPIDKIEHFSWAKRQLQSLGSAVVRAASGTTVRDAPSGFRAFTKDVAMRLNVFSTYTYTLETTIQAGQSNMRVLSVPVRTNPNLRPSRLMKSTHSYVFRSAVTIVRIYATYRPFTFFSLAATAFFAIGIGFGTWYLYFKFIGEGAGHIQSALASTASITIGFFLIMLGFLANLTGANRRLLERIDWRLQKLERNSSSTLESSTQEQTAMSPKEK